MSSLVSMRVLEYDALLARAYENDGSKMRQLVIGGIALVALIIGLAVLLDTATPNSTPGVSVVGGNIARLPQGETFILTHQVGKTQRALAARLTLMQAGGIISTCRFAKMAR